jgi:hypothetical protein
MQWKQLLGPFGFPFLFKDQREYLQVDASIFNVAVSNIFLDLAK